MPLSHNGRETNILVMMFRKMNNAGVFSVARNSTFTAMFPGFNGVTALYSVIT
jgi:hypothetical protein